MNLTAGLQYVESKDHARCPDALSHMEGSHMERVPTYEPTARPPGYADTEKGLVPYEHVTISVRGMTCSGCEAALQSAIGKLPTVRNAKTSAILSRAEFDIDSTVFDAESILKKLHAETNFACELITETQGAVLDLEPGGDLTTFVGLPRPQGVLDMQVSKGGRVARVCYDPRISGARGILEKLERDFGRPIELAPLPLDPSVAARRQDVIHEGTYLLCSVVLTLPVLLFAWASLPGNSEAYDGASLVLATLVQIGVSFKFYPPAWKSLRKLGVIGMDFLVAMSTTAAYIFSVVAFAFKQREKPLSTGEFFETSTLLATLILLGRFVSTVATQRAAKSVSLQSLQPRKALVYVGASEALKDIDVRLLQYGDVFKALPEGPIVTDGVVLAGTSDVDESMTSGESKLVTKGPGDTVVAGSVNTSGTLDVRLTHLPDENSISIIATAVERAKLENPRIQAIADRVAGWFVPCIIALTMLVFVIWVIVGKVGQGQDGREAAVQALTYAIATLVVCCPCAIGLAVPMVVVIAGGVAAKMGVVIKKAETIESAHKASHVLFDKTGTLTEGKMSVAVEKLIGERKNEARSIILGLLEDSQHPVSAAVAKHLKAQGVTKIQLNSVRILVGKGVEGRLGDTLIRAGNSRWLGLETSVPVRALTEDGFTVMCVTMDAELCAIFALEDSVRAEAAEVVSALRSRKIVVHIVSGDDNGAVQLVATKLGIEASKTVARCSPVDKQAYLKSVQANQGSIAIFCGDGTNDAPALAQADVGVHMSDGGTDVAKSAADAVLVRPDLRCIISLIDISRAAFHRILFNFAWTMIYNSIAILLAAGAFVKIRISPTYAGLGELVSILPVILVALQLKYVRFNRL